MLAFEPIERGIMRARRAAGDADARRALVWRIVLVSLLLLAGSFGIFLRELERGQSLAEARTVAINVFVVVEAMYLFNCRSLTRGHFRGLPTLRRPSARRRPHQGQPARTAGSTRYLWQDRSVDQRHAAGLCRRTQGGSGQDARRRNGGTRQAEVGCSRDTRDSGSNGKGDGEALASAVFASMADLHESGNECKSGLMPTPAPA
jgi:hypothetical protein